MAKKQWQIFEEACLEYLQAKFGEYGDFKLVGGVDSTTSDIVVTLSNGVKFYIEVKEDNAQCSQFVLIPDIEAHGFVYSKRNKLPMNPFMKNIIGYMNENFGSPVNSCVKNFKVRGKIRILAVTKRRKYEREPIYNFSTVYSAAGV